jgi:hypothetical protein
VSLLIRDPKSEFNAHIDAPAEVEVAEKQAKLEGAYDKAIQEPKARTIEIES